MKRILIAALMLCLVPAVAKADRGGFRYHDHDRGGSHFSISLGFGFGGYSHSDYCGPRYYSSYYTPTYIAPAPVYVAPPVVYEQPAYCAPAPVVVAPAPRVYYYSPAPCYTPRTYYYDSGVRFSYHR